MNTTNKTGGKDAIESTTGDGPSVSALEKTPFVSIPRQIEAGAREVHNLKGEPMAIYRQIAKACGGGIKGADDLMKGSMLLKSFYCHTVEMTRQETGEMVDSVRTVLIGEDGEQYQFVSLGVVSGLDTIRACFGDGPWNPPIKITVERTKVGKNNVLNIVPLD